MNEARTGKKDLSAWQSQSLPERVSSQVSLSIDDGTDPVTICILDLEVGESATLSMDAQPNGESSLISVDTQLTHKTDPLKTILIDTGNGSVSRQFMTTYSYDGVAGYFGPLYISGTEGPLDYLLEVFYRVYGFDIPVLCKISATFDDESDGGGDEEDDGGDDGFGWNIDLDRHLRLAVGESAHPDTL